MSNTKTDVVIPATTKAVFDAERKAAAEAAKITIAKADVVRYQTQVDDGTETLQQLRTLALARAGKHGSEEINGAVDNLTYNLRNYANQSLLAAKRKLEKLEGAQPADDGAEF